MFSCRSLTCLVLLAGLTTTSQAQLLIGDGSPVDPSVFEITRFADDLNFPVGMTILDDGSVLVAVSNGSKFSASQPGSLIRLADADGDGVAEMRETLTSDVPGGALTALERVGDLVFVAGAGREITIYRISSTESGYALDQLGRMQIDYGAEKWQHELSGLAARPAPGQPKSVDLFFQVGSVANYLETTREATFTSSLGPGASLVGDAIHMVRFTTKGRNVRNEVPVLVASGLRNAAGMAFHPATGDLYIAENGIDGLEPGTTAEAFSADELNIVSASDIGVSVPDFGFPESYIEYRTGSAIGTTGVPPTIAFLPIPEPADGAESEGPNDLVFAPQNFPTGVNSGVFIGFHGQYSSSGSANEENPLVYADPETGEYFHFVKNTVEGIGHMNGLLSTADQLYVADMSSNGSLQDAGFNAGVIFLIRSAGGSPAPQFEITVTGTTVAKNGRKSVSLAWDPAAVSTRKVQGYYASSDGPRPSDSSPNNGSGTFKIDEPGDGPFRIWLCEEGTGPDGTCSNEVEVAFASASVVVASAYPNPFNTETQVALELSEAAHIRVIIYDVLGREVARLADGAFTPGGHSFRWDAAAAVTGTYVIRVSVDGSQVVDSRRVVLLK